MKYIAKVFKVALIAILLLAATIAVNFLYEYVESEERDKVELSYGANEIWDWHDKWNRIQISKRDDADRSVLRKVHLKDKYIVYAFKDDDYKLNAFVKFVIDCNPLSVISTTQKFDDGSPKMLTCNKSGNGLIYRVSWTERGDDVVWSDDIDGFSVYENFGLWDFSVLDKEVTLKKAK